MNNRHLLHKGCSDYHHRITVCQCSFEKNHRLRPERFFVLGGAFVIEITSGSIRDAIPTSRGFTAFRVTKNSVTDLPEGLRGDAYGVAVFRNSLGIVFMIDMFSDCYCCVKNGGGWLTWKKISLQS